MLDKNLFNPTETLKAITKANKVNYKSIVDHFHSRITEVEDEMAFNLKLEMNPEKREMLRTSLNELIGLIGVKNKSKASYKPNSKSSTNIPNKSKHH